MNYSDTLAMLEQAKLKPIAAKERLDELIRKLRRDENFIIDDEIADAIETARDEYEFACQEYRELTKSIPEIATDLDYGRSVAAAMKDATESDRQMMKFHRKYYFQWLTEEERYQFAGAVTNESKDAYRLYRDLYLQRFRWINGREPTHSEMTAPTPYD